MEKTSQPITCSMCGNTFEAAGKGSCSACPLNKGCTLVCCPVCGYQTVNTSESKLARAVSFLFTLSSKEK